MRYFPHSPLVQIALVTSGLCIPVPSLPLQEEEHGGQRFILKAKHVRLTLIMYIFAVLSILLLNSVRKSKTKLQR